MTLTEKQIENALRATGGFVSQTAKMLNVTHVAIYKRLERSTYLTQVREEIQDSQLDIAETRLIEKIDSGDLGAICFYLKCKGKGRGYVEKQTIVINGDAEKPVMVKHGTTEELVKAVDDILMGRR